MPRFFGWRRVKQSPSAAIGVALIALVAAVSAVGPLVARDPNRILDEGLTDAGLPLSSQPELPLGTDALGRDELARLLHGGRVSLSVAFLATAVAVLVGVLSGLFAGYAGGRTDQAVSAAVDFILSLPFLLVAIALHRVVDEPSLFTLALLLGALSWTPLMRVTRAKTMQLRGLDFVVAARALGASHARILMVHILPNVLGPAIVLGTTLVARLIIVESAMSFLGLGVRPPTASWGSMLRDSQDYLGYAPQLLLYPGAMVVLTVFGFNLLGDGLRDVLDPRS